MLPSKKRLSRSQFDNFVSSKEQRTVFNTLGTLKYKDSEENKASVVISSKIEKRAVYRNKTRRYIYTLFADYFKNSKKPTSFIFYVSKNIKTLKKEDIKLLLNELLNKASK